MWEINEDTQHWYVVSTHDYMNMSISVNLNTQKVNKL